jgi:C-type mannose receptor
MMHVIISLIDQIDLWIGLHCRKQNNMFEWSNGDAVKYTNWARREPNSYEQDEDCVMIYYFDETDHRVRILSLKW